MIKMFLNGKRERTSKIEDKIYFKVKNLYFKQAGTKFKEKHRINKYLFKI